MDNTAQFVLITKRILRELGVLTETVRTGFLKVQEQISSIRDQQESANRRQEEQGEKPKILKAELHIPEAVQQEKRTSDNYHLAIQTAIAIATVLAFIAAAIYAGINYKMLREMRTANKAASDSFSQTLEQMKDQTKAQQGSLQAMQGVLALEQGLAEEERNVYRQMAQTSQATAQKDREIGTMAKGVGDSFQKIATSNAASANRDRPLFAIGSIAIPPKPEAGKALSVTVVARNYGLSPAIDAKISANCFVKDEALDVFYGRKKFSTLPPPAEGGMVVEPLVGNFFKGVSCRTISADEIKQIPVGKFPIAIAGDIYYMDRSGQPEHAEFCAATLTGGLTVSACLQHNNTEANTQGEK
jgi:hypothetical protein